MCFVLQFKVFIFCKWRISGRALVADLGQSRRQLVQERHKTLVKTASTKQFMRILFGMGTFLDHNLNPSIGCKFAF